MALGVSDTLEIVKDASKYKKKLEELAKAEADAKAAMEKSKQLNKEVFAEVDAARKELDKLNAQRRQLLDEGTKPIQEANLALREREQKLDVQEKRVKTMSENLKAERAEVKKEKEALKDKEVAFQQRVAEFERNVKVLCEGA